MSIPNFDAMTQEELMNFWACYSRCGRKKAAELIGGARKGYTKLTRDLANYASNKATAMWCRERGDIERAQMYEKVCDRIYDGLPVDLKW